MLSDREILRSGKTVRIEKSIGNANNTNSSIDLFCEFCDIPNLKIEYKSGTASINADKIKTQFIERDLYNASNLNEIQWRMEGTGMTKDKLKLWMKENISSLNEVKNNSTISKQKFTDWFDLDDVNSSIINSDIDFFVDNYYQLIFK